MVAELGLKLLLPEYDAMMLCPVPPAESEFMVSVALPEFNIVIPSVVVPSENVTVPVGIRVELYTVAVKVTVWLNSDGLTDDFNMIVVLHLEFEITGRFPVTGFPVIVLPQ